MPPINAGTPWTDVHDAELIGLLEEGAAIQSIADLLGRTRLAIVQRIARLHDEHLLYIRSVL